MRILSLNQDPGIGSSKKKGASVHLQAIRQAFAAMGHEVMEMDDPDGIQLNAFSEQHRSSSPIDLVYERYALGKVGGSRFAERYGIPHVLEVNAPLSEEAARWRNGIPDVASEAAERAVFAKARHVIAVSDDTKRYSVERGASESSVTVIANGFDSEVFYPRDRAACKEQLGVSRDRFVIGFHGRLRPWHQFETLVDAVAMLVGRGLPFHLLTIGEGDYLKLARPQLNDSVHTHLSWVDVKELGRLVGAYDALPLMYSVNEPCYFSPLKLLEAMACGAVPVVPKIGAMAELVQRHESGLVYEEGELVSSLLRLYLNPEQLAAMSRSSATQASGHTWRHVAEATLRVSGV